MTFWRLQPSKKPTQKFDEFPRWPLGKLKTPKSYSEIEYPLGVLCIGIFSNYPIIN